MIVVADTSPLLHLARIGRLDLVFTAVGPVLVPRTVWSELIQPGTRGDVVEALRAAAWIDVRDDPPAADLGWKPVQALRDDGFWLSESLAVRFLSTVGEPPG